MEERTIEQLGPAGSPHREHQLGAMKDGVTVKLTVAQILGLINAEDVQVGLAAATSDDTFADTDALLYLSGSSLKRGAITGWISSIFNGARKIANAWFLSSFRLWDAADNTKGLAFNLAAISTGTTRTITFPNADVDLTGVSKETPDYESPEITLVASGSGTVAHSLGVKPRRVEAVLVCKTGEYGYAANDSIHLKSWFYIDGSGNTRGVTIGDSATVLFYEIGNTGPIILFHRSSTAFVDITLANWRLVLRAWK